MSRNIKRIAVLMIAVLSFSLTAEAQQLIGGWNRISSAADADWWETNAHIYDDIGFDALMLAIEDYDADAMQRVMDENKNRHFRVIVTIDGMRYLIPAIKFLSKYKDYQNADGERVLSGAILGWDRVNNIHPDQSWQEIHDELSAARALVDATIPDLPVYLTVSYGVEGMEPWYEAVKTIPHDGIWLWNVWGWSADLTNPMNYFLSKGETNIIDGGVYGFNWWKPPYRSDLIERSSTKVKELWGELQANGYEGLNLLFNFQPSEPFGDKRLLDENEQPTAMYKALKSLKNPSTNLS